MRTVATTPEAQRPSAMPLLLPRVMTRYAGNSFLRPHSSDSTEKINSTDARFLDYRRRPLNPKMFTSSPSSS